MGYEENGGQEPTGHAQNTVHIFTGLLAFSSTRLLVLLIKIRNSRLCTYYIYFLP